MRGIGRTAAVLVACALAGALVGCERDPVGPVDPTSAPPSTSASPTPTGPTPPVMPEAARADTAAGAIAFVAHYVDLMNFSAMTGRTSEMRSLSKSCEACDSYMATYERIQKRGGSSTNPGWRSEADVSESSGDGFRVLTTIETERFTFRESADANEQTVEPTSYKLIFDVEYTPAGPRLVLIDEQVV